EGFGIGRNAVTMQESAPRATAADAAHVSPAALQRVSASGGTQTSQLAPSSIAHASGSGISSTYGGSSAAGNSTGATGTSGKTEGYQLSGRMPSGNNIVALNSAAGRGPSSFNPGGRDATVGKGSRSSGGNDLKDISKRSAEVARNRNRAANEGSSAFLASSQNSGGMTFDNGMETTETGSADFAAPEARRLKAIGDWGQKEDDRAQKQQKRMSTLFAVLMGLIAATVTLVPIIKALKQLGKTPYLGIAANAWAWILAGVLAAAWGVCMAQAILYGKDYFWPNNDWSWLAFGALLVGGISIAVIASVVIGTKVVEGEEAIGKAKGALTMGAKDMVGQVVSVGGSLGQTALKEAEMDAINKQNHK
ncbi:MAG: hypothetical protein IKP96_00870, partial [Elusimicrobiaceae bacterium]|nr:hypothetical protein [Elusimicrobiaceae bacterium]